MECFKKKEVRNEKGGINFNVCSGFSLVEWGRFPLYFSSFTRKNVPLYQKASLHGWVHGQK
jgi:hypothetical protein